MDAMTFLSATATVLGGWLAFDLVLVALWCVALSLGRRAGRSRRRA